MSKLVAFATYSRFSSALNNNDIDEHSLNFIIDTGQLYTHGIYLNNVTFGAEANGGVPITIAGVTKTLSLSNHTHSTYLEKNSNIDIGNYKIVSDTTDLLYLDNNRINIGDANTSTYIKGPAYRDSYTILDTGNFSITNLTLNGTVLSNVALFTYGTSRFQLDYIKRVNTSSIFDNLVSYTCLGTTNVDLKNYGFVTFYTSEGTLNSPWALLRININDKALEYRTSTSTTWTNVTTPVLPVNALNTAGIVTAPDATTMNKVWKTDANGNPGWRDEVYSSFHDLQFLSVSGTNMMVYNSQATKTIVAGTNISFTYSDDVLTINSLTFTDTWRGIYIDQVSKLSTSITTKALNFKGAGGITLTYTAAGENDDYSTLQISSTTYSTATDSVLGLVKVGTTLDNLTGYTAVHIKDGTIYYKDTTYSFSNLKFQQVSGTDLMIYNSLAERTILAGPNITFAHNDNVLTITATDTWTAFTAATADSAGTAGYIQAPAGANNKFFRGDNTWQTINLNVSSALYVGASNGTSTSLQTTNGNVYLIFAEGSSYSRYQLLGSGRASVICDANGNITINSNGYSNFTAATDSIAGTAGLVPAPAINQLGSSNYYLRADGTWAIPPNTWIAWVGATDQANGTAGYMPAPTIAQRELYLRGDGTWQSLSLSTHNHDDRYVNVTGDIMTGTLTITEYGPTIHNCVNGNWAFLRFTAYTDSTSNMYDIGTHPARDTFEIRRNGANNWAFSPTIFYGYADNTYYLGSTTYRWANIYSTFGNFSSTLTAGTVTTGKVHSNANSSTDLTHHATDSEVALETGDGSGNISAWIWRENYSYNWGMFHDNSTDDVIFVGNDTERVRIALGSNSLKVGGTEVSLNGHTHSYLPLSGGTLTSSSYTNILSLNGSAGSEVGIVFLRYGNYKGWIGYMDGGYMYMYNQARNGYLKYHDNGTLTFEEYTVYHSGNLTNLSQLTNGPGYLTETTLPYRLQASANGSEHPTTPDDFMVSGFAWCSSGSPGGGGDCNLITVAHNASGWCHQLAFKFNSVGTTGTTYDSKDLWTRMYNNNSKVWTNWFTIVTSGNWDKVIPYPAGFTSRGTSDWSGVTGTLATDWSVNGAEIMFKYDGSMLNVITDGRFYQGIDIYGASKRVLDEYDVSHTKWGDSDTLDGYHLSSLVNKSGENLIIGTTHASTTGWGETGWEGAISTEDATNGIYNFQATNGWHSMYYALPSEYGNKVISYSFDAKIDSSRTTNPTWSIFVGRKNNHEGVHVITSLVPTDSWGHVTGTFTTESTPYFSIVIWGTDYSGNTVWMNVKNLKIELGDLPSVWTSAHADTIWDNIPGKPSTFSPSTHYHDDRYLRLIGGTISNGSNWTTINFVRTGVGSGAVGGIDPAGLYFYHSDGTNNLDMYLKAGDGLRVGGKLVWNEGNDGSGSGLDADLLDGLDSTEFIRIKTIAVTGAKDANSYNQANTLYRSAGDLVSASDYSTSAWNNFPFTKPDGGWALLDIAEGGYHRQIAGRYSDDHLYVRSQSWDPNGFWTNRSWHQIAFTDELPTKSSWNYDDRYVDVTGDTMSGALIFSGVTGGDYNEGIRIQDAANKWAGITLGATGTSGITPQSGGVAWFIAKNPGGTMMITPNSSNANNGLKLINAGDAYWRNNILLHAGNYTTYVYDKTTSDGRYLRKDTNDSTAYTIDYTSSGYGIRCGGIYGHFGSDGELIHLYQRVNIGYPYGWGGQEAPTYGLSVYGGCSLATNIGSVGIGTTSPETKLDVDGIQQIYQRGLDNTAFKNLLLLKAQNNTETSGDNWGESYPTFGIGFRRYWTSGGNPYGETTCAGIYATISGSWRGGLVFRTKNNQTPGGTHDVTALRLAPSGAASFASTVTASGFIKANSSDSYVLLGGGGHAALRTASASANSGWTNYNTDSAIIPTMSFIAYWNGAYSGTSSNLKYCNLGLFGSIVTKATGDYLSVAGGDMNANSKIYWRNFGTNYFGQGTGDGASDSTYNMCISSWYGFAIVNGCSAGDVSLGTPAWLCNARYGSTTQKGSATATSFYSTSDRSKKQDITILSEHIRKFQLKSNKKYAYGVIALEVEEVFREGEEGNMTVNYDSILSYYIGLLENRVRELENDVVTLKNKLNNG